MVWTDKNYCVGEVCNILYRYLSSALRRHFFITDKVTKLFHHLLATTSSLIQCKFPHHTVATKNNALCATISCILYLRKIKNRYIVHVFIFVSFKKREMKPVSKQEMLTVKCCLNLQFRANIRRIQICFLIFFKTETSGTRASFCLVVFPGRL